MPGWPDMKQETFTRVVKYGALSLAALVISPIIFATVYELP